ncbi:MAG TPA: L,D-transpeptidase [Gaiellaceae bacterium]|jgi:lipoprotein-anchoring transpeptidase ErfK/SrfK|nr:L,D-transpeptidase [Gaiellaceae bacterium]
MRRAAPVAVSKRGRARVSCATAGSLAPTGGRSYAVTVRTLAVVRAQPGRGRVLGRFPKIDLNGYPTTLGVVGARVGPRCAVAWYRVQVPTFPNGRTGWVAAGSVAAFAVRSRIVVELSTRRLVAFRAGKPVFRARVTVGAPETPTPTGRYFVDERFVLDDPNGPFGVAALGISGHSDVLRDWVQGGPIALHGTDEPGAIGRAVSHGCIRLANDDMRRLFALTPAGTPVDIRA